MSFRFLHIADLHLGADFSGQGELAPRLRQAQRDSLRAAVDFCLQERVHALLIAGDLAHQEAVDPETSAFIRTQLYRLHTEGIGVLYAHGNHDPASGALTLPPWAEVFDSRFARMVQVRTPSGEAVGVVVGAGFARPQQMDSLAGGFPRRHDRLPTVGLMHTHLLEEGGRDTPYAPASLSQLEGLRYDYWALGHIHRRQSYGEHIRYSGCLCAAGFGDPGPQGGLYVELSGQGTPRVRFVPLAQVRFEQLVPEHLEAVGDEAALYSLLEGELARLALPVPSVVRITLKGETACWQLLTGPGGAALLERMGRRLEQETGMLRITLLAEDISAPAGADDLRGQISLVGEMLDTLQAAQSDDELADRLLDALAPLGLAGCQHGSREQQRSYIRQLMPDMEALVLERMRKEDGGQ